MLEREKFSLERVRTEMRQWSFSSLLYRIVWMDGKVTNACFMAQEK